MWSQQRFLLYHPHYHTGAPGTYGLQGFSDIVLQDEDGTHIIAWVHKANAGYPTILFFHGNGGDMSYSAGFYAAIANAGFGVLAIDYRGYGASEGKPTEQGLYQDARTVITYASHTLDLPSEQIILYGESLGTGVAVQMAMEFPVSAIVLQSPYASIGAVGQEMYPWLPVNYLLEDKFDSLSKIGRVHAKLLLIHGEKDTLVPVSNGRKIFAAANEPKEAVYYPERGHNDMDVEQRLGPLVAFARKYNLINVAR